MIGWLNGKVLWKQAPQVGIDVHGVGYDLEVPLTTYFKLPAVGEPVALYTQLIVREDAHLLYGFAAERERALFRALLKVNGVGAKLAAAILSGLAVDEFIRCVRDRDVAGLTRLPGVGKKTAERLIVELRDRLEGADGTAAAVPSGTARPETSARSAVQDAVSALMTLGYKPQEAHRMVQPVQTAGLTCEEILRRALQGTGK